MPRDYNVLCVEVDLILWNLWIYVLPRNSLKGKVL